MRSCVGIHWPAGLALFCFLNLDLGYLSYLGCSRRVKEMGVRVRVRARMGGLRLSVDGWEVATFETESGGPFIHSCGVRLFLVSWLP
jgi:hypothetical protein